MLGLWVFSGDKHFSIEKVDGYVDDVVVKDDANDMKDHTKAANAPPTPRPLHEVINDQAHAFGLDAFHRCVCASNPRITAERAAKLDALGFLWDTCKRKR